MEKWKDLRIKMRTIIQQLRAAFWSVHYVPGTVHILTHLHVFTHLHLFTHFAYIYIYLRKGFTYIYTLTLTSK